MRRGLGGIAVVACVMLLAGCGKHYLKQYSFSDRTIALVWIEPPAPDLLHGWYNVDIGGNAIQNVISGGATIAKELEAHKARARLDSASLNVDVTDRLAENTLLRASRYLGTRMAASPDSSDYLLEINMRSFGIDARSNHATHLYVRAEAVLLDRKTGREIWREKVRGTDRLTPYIIGTRDVPSAIFTAATLHTVTVGQFERALEQLMTYTSTLIADELREDLREVRDR